MYISVNSRILVCTSVYSRLYECICESQPPTDSVNPRNNKFIYIYIYTLSPEQSNQPKTARQHNPLEPSALKSGRSKKKSIYRQKPPQKNCVPFKYWKVKYCKNFQFWKNWGRGGEGRISAYPKNLTFEAHERRSLTYWYFWNDSHSISFYPKG